MDEKNDMDSMDGRRGKVGVAARQPDRDTSASDEQKRGSRWRGARLALAGIAVAFATVVGLFGATVGSIMRYDAASWNGHADAAVVLGAAVVAGKPTPVFRARIDHAIDLYKQGRVASIVFTGGVGGGDRISEAEAARRYAVERGVDPDSILLETDSTSTWENLTKAHTLLRDEGIARVVIVSDSLHLKRAMRMARDLGMDAAASGTPYSVYRSRSKQLKFACREAYFYWKYRLFGPPSPDQTETPGAGEARVNPAGSVYPVYSAGGCAWQTV